MVALAASDTDRLLGSWGATGYDPNDAHYEGGDVVSSRGLWLWDNDPIFHALVETLVQGTVGPTGLQYRSQYSQLDDGTTSPEEDKMRRQINASITRATAGFRFDARGMLTRREMSQVMVRHAINSGDAFSARLWRPNRPGRQVQGTCWSIIHSARCCNPDFGPNSSTRVNGIQLDADGNRTGAWFLKAHPQSRINRSFDWVYIPFFGSDSHPSLLHLMAPGHPEQYRGVGWAGPVIPLLRFLGRTMEAKVIADLMKASIGFVIECDDPAAMAKADRNGAELVKTTKIRPGTKYYVKKGTNWKELNWQFNGSDFEAWGDFLLKIVCANFQIPYEFVLQQLTQTNLAASRVALIQAYKTFQGHQEWLIDRVEEPWNQSVIVEDIARGRLDLSNQDLDLVFKSRYLRPSRPFPDPNREADAAIKRTQSLAVALSTVQGELGYDLEEEVPAKRNDQQLLDANGITIDHVAGNGVSTPAAPAADSTEDPSADPATTPTKKAA